MALKSFLRYFNIQLSLRKIFVCTIFITQSIVPQIVDFAESMGGIKSEYIKATVVDQSGYIYCVGSFTSPTFNVGNKTIQNRGDNNEDVFIVKFDSMGTIQWLKGFGGIGWDYGESVAADKWGNIYLAGYFTSSSMYFDTTIVNLNGGVDAFLIKLTSEGEIKWVKSAGGVSGDHAHSVAVDKGGSVFLAGSFSSPSITFDSLTLVRSAGTDIFIVKYDSMGNAQWAKSTSGNAEKQVFDIKIDNLENILVAGYFNGEQLIFDGILINNQGYYDAFLLKLSQNGSGIWGGGIGGVAGDHGTALTTDTEGSVYFTGRFSSPSMNVGGTTLHCSGANDIFLVKYSSSGSINWAKSFGAINNEFPSAITADAYNNLYLTGTYTSPNLEFDDFILNKQDGSDIFLVKFNSNGITLWAKSIGGRSDDQGYALTMFDEQRIIFGGSFSSDTLRFGNTTLINNGSSDVLLLKIVETFTNFIAPIGNEAWQVGTTHNIVWSSNDDGELSIELSTNNGLTWLLIRNSFPARAGAYNFTIPPFQYSAECRIRLSSLNYKLKMISEKFIITPELVPIITVKSPNESVIWYYDSTYVIRWQKSGIIDNVKIEYTMNNGLSWSTIVDSWPADSLFFNWSIPDVASNTSRIKITDTDNNLVYDYSDSLFSIGNIFIISPSFSSTLKAGTNTTISWYSTVGNFVDILLSTDNGFSWGGIVENIQADKGTYLWNIPQLSSDSSRLKIVTSTGSFTRVSSNFIIWQPVYSTQFPTLGWTSLRFDEQKLSLTMFVITQDSISVYYNRFGNHVMLQLKLEFKLHNFSEKKGEFLCDRTNAIPLSKKPLS